MIIRRANHYTTAHGEYILMHALRGDLNVRPTLALKVNTHTNTNTAPLTPIVTSNSTT